MNWGEMKAVIESEAARRGVDADRMEVVVFTEEGWQVDISSADIDIMTGKVSVGAEVYGEQIDWEGDI